MASKGNKSIAVFLVASLLFFSLEGVRGTSPSRRNPGKATCPRDALKLGVCANILGLVNVVVGSPPTLPCCSLLQGLIDLEAAVCLCTAIRANVLNIVDLNVRLAISLILNACGRRLPRGFQCLL